MNLLKKCLFLSLSVFWLNSNPSPSIAQDVVEVPSFKKGFSELVKKVGPGVVNISTFARPQQSPRGMPRMYEDEVFRRFFEEFFGGRLPPPSGPNSPRQGLPAGPSQPTPLALGTGFVIDAAEGLILTNFHVVQGAEEVKIQFAEEEGEELSPAEIIGRDPELDVALLKVNVKRKLTAIRLGDSQSVEVGEYVIAIGNPLGYGHTVSHGILSAKGRTNPMFRLGKYLQTDASINPGNSGGPLVNTSGEVIGINNAIDARAQGIGFAIPINLVKHVLPQLKSKGMVSRGYLGVGVAELTGEMVAELGLKKGTDGVLIADVGPDSPADQAGIRAYDVVTEVNGETIKNPQELTLKITAVNVGDSVQLKYYRDGKAKTAKVKVGERPVANAAGERIRPKRERAPLRGSSQAIADFGFTVQTIRKQEAELWRLPPSAFGKENSIVVVSELEPGGPAERSGLSRGDVILDIAGRKVKSMKAIERSLKGIKKSVMMRVQRFTAQGAPYVSVVVLAKD